MKAIKRFIVMPCVVVMGLLSIAGFGSMQIGAAQAAMPIPTVDAQFMPGGSSPIDKGCFSSPTDFAYRYCDLGNVYLVVSGSQIAQSFMAVYGSDLTLGDLINAWGTPTGADYTSFTISLYWPDRFAYVSGPFGPNSWVRTIAYGKPRRVVGPWRGYLSVDRAP